MPKGFKWEEISFDRYNHPIEWAKSEKTDSIGGTLYEAANIDFHCTTDKKRESLARNLSNKVRTKFKPTNANEKFETIFSNINKDGKLYLTQYGYEIIKKLYGNPKPVNDNPNDNNEESSSEDENNSSVRDSKYKRKYKALNTKYKKLKEEHDNLIQAYCDLEKKLVAEKTKNSESEQENNQQQTQINSSIISSNPSQFFIPNRVDTQNNKTEVPKNTRLTPTFYSEE